MVLNDAREFLASDNWYTEHGLPYRRGYLFHGCPGSVKTSPVRANAGELDLDIFVINFRKRGLDDASLGDLMAELPARSIALIEEIDAAFGLSFVRFEGAAGRDDTEREPLVGQCATRNRAENTANFE